jgi:hypothetical protein
MSPDGRPVLLSRTVKMMVLAADELFAGGVSRQRGQAGEPLHVLFNFCIELYRNKIVI